MCAFARLQSPFVSGIMASGKGLRLFPPQRVFAARRLAHVYCIRRRLRAGVTIKKEGISMKNVTIRLTMMTDHVKNFVSLVNRYPYDMDLRSGRFVVDAKSILGIFSLDLSKPILMSIYSDDCDDLLKELEPYIVKDQAEHS